VILGNTSAYLTISDPVINYFYASPTHIPASGSTTLYYGTQNGASANINGTPVPLNNGSLVVTPSVSTVYTLTVSNQYATKQATVIVFVATPANPNYYQHAFRHEKGAAPFYPILPLRGESVNSANGNLFFTIPLLSRPGRNGMGVDLALAYNSKIWDFFVQGSTLYATLAESESWVGPGWSLLVGRVIDDSANGHYYVTLSDGSNHDLTYYGGAWRSRDSSYLVYNPATYKLTLKGGLNLTFNHVDQFRSYTRYATRVQDVNGNYIEISYAGFGGKINTIQDTLGNTYTFLLNSSGCLQYIKYWNTLDVSQATSTITFNYQNQALAFGSGATTNPVVPAQTMLTEVIYPSGLRYSLAYASSGEISEITQPLCAKSRYFYGSRNIYDRLLARTVPDHPVTSHDMNDANWHTWNYYANSGIPSYTTILFPNGTTVTHYMQKSSPGWADGFVTKVTESGSPGTESRVDWTQDDTQLTAILNPRAPYREKVLLGGTSQVLRTEYSYAAAGDYSGNVKEIREYSFAGSLRRKTQFDYLHEANSTYIGLNILDRVTAARIYDGAGVLIAKSATGYDAYTPLYSATNAIRHDAAYGTTFTYRGLPTSTTRWYNLASDLSITSTVKYDECGNPRETTDPRSYTSAVSYWLSSADYAYAFPLYALNAKGHATQASYSYKSGVLLSQTDANGQVATMTYDAKDRIIKVVKTLGGTVKGGTIYAYSDTCNCSTYVYPYADIYKFLSGVIDLSNTNYVKETGQLDSMGRLKSSTVNDSVGGNIQTENTYGSWGQLHQASVPHRAGATAYPVTYSYGGLSFLSSVSMAEGGSVAYSYSNKTATVTNTDGMRRKYTYQEDGKVAEVLEEDESGNLTIATNYGYDAMGRLLSIVQGVQTRSFTYDNLGRLLSETHPESGAATYIYDANSNLVSKTDARGISTTYIYDELNRVTQKNHSDSTPSVSYYYDSVPPGSPITIAHPIGRLTRVTTTAGSVTASSYYSYCSCSSVDQEATVITDGTTKTYITTYAHNYLGGVTSTTYPNGKVVTVTRDASGRESKVSTTVSGQSVDIVRSASYHGPAGQLTQIQYGLRLGSYPYWVNSSYTYSAKTGRLTQLQTYGLRQNFNYGTPANSSIQTGQIFDITDEYSPQNNQHFEYDRRGRLTAFWVAPARGDAYTRKITWTYDQYGNMLSMLDDPLDPYNCPSPGCLTQYYVDSATNRLPYWQDRMGGYTATYDSAGNNTGGRTFDAESRLASMWYDSYLYDGNSRRLRKLFATQYQTEKTYYIYGATGQLLVEDNWTADTQKNQIYFNGQLVATHDQADYVKFFFKDYLGSNYSTILVTPGGSDWSMDWEMVQMSVSLPFGFMGYNWNGAAPDRYTGKPNDSTGLIYFGARYCDLNGIAPTLRWISADPITARIYDPLSLNKYSYVRNDPVNFIDPDGRLIQGPEGGPPEGYFDNLEYWNWWDPPAAPNGIVDPVDGGPLSGGANGWGPYHRDRATECRQIAVQEGADIKQLPNAKTLNWIMSAYVAYGADPTILAVLWSVETDFETEDMSMHTNDSGTIDYGPLQINDFWKLNDPVWQTKYNPGGNDLKKDVWASFFSAAHDLADHGASEAKPNLVQAIEWWHGINFDTTPYAVKVSDRLAGIMEMFFCMKADKEP
jgi:RHS repeat-associated protein